MFDRLHHTSARLCTIKPPLQGQLGLAVGGGGGPSSRAMSFIRRSLLIATLLRDSRIISLKGYSAYFAAIQLRLAEFKTIQDDLQPSREQCFRLNLAKLLGGTGQARIFAGFTAKMLQLDT